MEGRRALFRSSSILSHVEGSGPTAFAHKRITDSAQLVGDRREKCTSYFTEPVQWMEPALLGVMEGQVKGSMHFSFWMVGFGFFVKADKLFLFPDMKAHTQGPKSPSLSCVNFASYEQILKR